MTRIRLHSKVWLEFRGEALLGDGRYRLLQAVAQTGSINGAARRLGISYRKAWTQLQAMEANAPFALLESRSGGRGGGCTLLTAEAAALLESFATLRERIREQDDRIFQEEFARWL